MLRIRSSRLSWWSKSLPDGLEEMSDLLEQTLGCFDILRLQNFGLEVADVVNFSGQTNDLTPSREMKMQDFEAKSVSL
jgi:hypothetical protein